MSVDFSVQPNHFTFRLPDESQYLFKGLVELLHPNDQKCTCVRGLAITALRECPMLDNPDTPWNIEAYERPNTVTIVCKNQICSDKPCLGIFANPAYPFYETYIEPANDIPLAVDIIIPNTLK